MSFVSFSFLFLLAAVLLARFTFGRTKQSPLYLAVLVLASLTFYAWHIPAYLLILLASTCVDYAAGDYLGRPGRPRVARRAALVASLGTNLGLLAVFKYADFFAVEVQGIAERFGLELSFGTLGWVLPMGISFYTFQSMSYTIDVYRGVLAPFRGFWKFLLFVSFFPQLMAGPIVRAKHFLYQIGRKRLPRLPFIYEGIYLLIQGYFLKTVVSGHLGALVDEYWYAAAAEGASSVLRLFRLGWSPNAQCTLR